MFAYPFIAGMTFLLGCFGLNEIKLSRMKAHKDE